MTDPFDDLERQLRRRVAERAPSKSRRRRLLGLPPLAIGGVGLALTAGSLAATTLRPTTSDTKRAEVAVHHAVSKTMRGGACARIGVSDDPKVRPDLHRPVLAAIKDVLPWIDAPQTAAEQRRAEQFAQRLRLRQRARLIAGTLRAVRVGGDYLLVSVEGDAPWFAASDPEGCKAARRLAVIDELGDQPTPALKVALSQIDRQVDTSRETQGLSIIYGTAGCPQPFRCGGGGGSQLIDPHGLKPNRTVRIGVKSWGGSKRGVERYIGIARAETAAITVRPSHPSTLGPVPKRAIVRERLWLLDLPRNTGPVTLTEVTATGERVRSMRIRDRTRKMARAKRDR